MATAGILSNEELKTLYAAIKLNPAQLKATEAAAALGVPSSTFSYRYGNAIKKIEAAFPEVKDMGNGGNGAPAATPKKRKAKGSAKGGPTPKKEKVDAAAKDEYGNGSNGVAEVNEEGAKDAVAKSDVPNGDDGDTEVKEETEP